MTKNILIPLVVLVVAAGAWLFFKAPAQKYAAITNFEQCAAAGFPIMESYPEQCKTPDGRTFVRQITPDYSDLIKVDAPVANAKVASPLTVTGQARGSWYFEASFPVKLIDANDTVLAQGPAQAQGEWMTTEFVPFKAVLTFAPPQTATGFLIVHNDNPSGLPQNDKELRIPVTFGSAVGTSGVRGYVHVGPTCPVERIPPDPNCSDRPYATSIEVHRPDETLVATTRSGEDGKFSLALAPGSYILRPIIANVLPACAEERVTVFSNAFANVDISCDSGIR